MTSKAAILALQAPSNCGSLSFTYGLSAGPLKGRTTGKPLGEWIERDAETFDFASGHLMIDGRRTLAARPVVTATLIRQPAARLVSEFNYVHGAYHDRHRLDGKIMEEQPDLAIGNGNPALKAASLDLDSWIDFVAETGTGSMVEWVLRWSGLGGHGEAPAFLRNPEWFTLLTGWIDAQIDHVFVTELIEEALFTATRKLMTGPPAPWIRLQPFKPKHAHVSGIPPAQRQRIDQIVEADLRLYRHYRDRFEAELRHFPFDEEFLAYKAHCQARDANLRAAFRRRDNSYMPAAIMGDRQLLRRYTMLFGAATAASAG